MNLARYNSVLIKFREEIRRKKTKLTRRISAGIRFGRYSKLAKEFTRALTCAYLSRRER